MVLENIRYFSKFGFRSSLITLFKVFGRAKNIMEFHN